MNHIGPLGQINKNFKGSIYNLQILWSDGSKTWEKASDFIKDDPEGVKQYFKEQGIKYDPEESSNSDPFLAMKH